MKELVLGAGLIYTGAGSLKCLEKLAMSRTFIVTGGSSMFKNGTIARIEEMLQAKGCAFHIYAGVAQNPDTEAILAGVAAMREFKPDTVIGVGGGSSIDAAKAMTLLFEYPEITFDNILKTALPGSLKKVKLIAIPSTSGTASEVTRSSIVTFKQMEFKLGIRSNALVPSVAILDPELTLSMPKALVAETGMDAMTHAVESYLNPNADEFTTSLAVGAIEGIFSCLPDSYHAGTLAAREKMHYYQCMAGIAFANSGLGAVHGIAHALGGKFDMGHGQLNAICLPYVLIYNAQEPVVREKLALLARRVGQDDIITAIGSLNEALSIPKSLQQTGITAEQFEAALPQLVINALEGPTVPTVGNPRPLDETAMETLLRKIFSGNQC